MYIGEFLFKWSRAEFNSVQAAHYDFVQRIACMVLVESAMKANYLNKFLLNSCMDKTLIIWTFVRVKRNNLLSTIHTFCSSSSSRDICGSAICQRNKCEISA